MGIAVKTLKFFVILLIITLLIGLAIGRSTNADTLMVEVFDIEQDKVVKMIPVDDEMQEEAKSYIDNIKDMKRELRLIPSKGTMIKIPFDNPLPVSNKWMSTHLEHVIVVVPENEELDPFIILVNEGVINAFYVDANMNEILELVTNENLQL